jgi:rubrerythrin
MQPHREEALKLFDKATETENEGIKYYEEAAAKVQDIKAREIFLSLADGERRHVKLIEGAKKDARDMYSSHAWTGDFVGEIGKEIEAIGRLYLPKLKGEIISANALDALNLGIQVEQASIAFYSNAKNKITAPGVSTLFSTLCNFETVHLLFLELAVKDIKPGSKRN